MKELRKEDIKQEVFDLYDDCGFRSRCLMAAYIKFIPFYPAHLHKGSYSHIHGSR